MLKVFLVEDEFLIRDAIKRTLNWEQEGFELVGEAGDGERAYPMIAETEPDILITDIRMPFMDGLELSRLVSRNLPKTKIMILSGYDDFSYAKEAIRLGVAEYLLKPVSGEQLLETLKRIGTVIESERNQADYKRIYEEERNERIRLEKAGFLKKILSGQCSMAEAVEQGSLVGIELTAPCYAVMQLQWIPSNGAPVQSERLISDLKEQLENEIEAMKGTEIYEQVGGIFCLLLTGAFQSEVQRTEEQILEAIRTLTRNQPELMYFASVGMPVARLSEIHDSYQGAARLFARRFLCTESRIFRCGTDDAAEPVLPESEARGEHIDLSSFNIRLIDRKILQSFVRSGTEEEIPAFLEEVLDSMGSSNLSSRMLRQYLAVDFYLTLAAYLQTAGHSAEETETLLPPPSTIRELESLATMEQYLRTVLAKVIHLRNESSESRYASVIHEADRYIESHYRENGISLGEVAEAVGMSPNHFSRIYSQETGRTFVEALTAVRMEKAKELLLATDAPSSEIGLRVGYSDPHYFYYSFKKTQNMTPKEFRQGRMRDVQI